MGKQYVNQHIVPKRYLDRFASHVDGKNIIRTRYYVKGKPKFFPASTSDVGYIKNFYDVTDKEDPKYWEHFFANEIDTLCGTEMENIISAATLGNNKSAVLTDHAIEVLAKIIVAQMMRIPSTFDHVKGIYPRIEKEVKEQALSIIPTSLMSKYERKIKEISLDEQWQKEQVLNHSFDQVNFDRYCRLLQDRIWVVYVNTLRTVIPFVTSDNPVLVEGVGTSEIGLFHNGLANPATCIFYPLSPAIAVASYSKRGIVGVAKDNLDRRKVLLDEYKFILDKDCKIMEQAYHHSFIPQTFYDEIMKDEE